MVKEFKISTIVKKCDSPFILTLNDNSHLIGDYARALENYIQTGMNVKVDGYTRGNDFLIEKIVFTDGVKKGVQVNSYI